MNQLRQFVEDGRERYPEAALAMFTFVDEVKKRIRKYIEKRADWGPLDFRARGREIVEGSPAGGWSIGCYVNGTLRGHDIKLWLGYWWCAPGAKNRAAICLGISEGPDSLKAFEYDDSVNGIEALYLYERTYLVAAMPESLDPTAALDSELALVLKAMTMYQSGDS